MTPPSPSGPATALAPPLHATAGFSFDSPDDAARRAVKPRVADFYSRFGNPTVQALVDAVAALEGAEAGLATASGMGAVSTVVLGLCSAGDHIVTQRQLFSATKQLFETVCPRFGIDVTFVDAVDTGAWRDAVQPGRTKLVFAESPANPTLELVDLAALGQLGVGPATVVDSTMATPVAQQPLAAGVDLVLHSATKALGGHNDATLGVVVGDKMLTNELWQYSVIHGACPSPYDAHNVLRGLKTLELRFAHQATSAAALAKLLAEHPAVREVYHPPLVAGCGVVSFELDGGSEAARTVLDALTVPLLAPSLGGPETLVNHPASMTHAALSPDQRAAAGIGEGMIRISVGLEPTGALLADFGSALAVVGAGIGIGVGAAL